MAETLHKSFNLSFTDFVDHIARIYASAEGMLHHVVICNIGSGKMVCEADEA